MTNDSVLPLPREKLFLSLTPFLTYTHYYSYMSGRRTSRGTLLTVLGARSTRPVVATVSGAPVPSAAASTASASSAAARPASFLRACCIYVRVPGYLARWKPVGEDGMNQVAEDTLDTTRSGPPTGVLL